MGLITCNKLTKETAINSNRTILITGASSGIGEALAKRYARTGVSLYLCGRNSHRLNSVSNDCCALGATVDAELLDDDGWLDATQYKYILSLYIPDNYDFDEGTFDSVDYYLTAANIYLKFQDNQSF